jgi:hypothetical protein
MKSFSLSDSELLELDNGLEVVGLKEGKALLFTIKIQLKGEGIVRLEELLQLYSFIIQ